MRKLFFTLAAFGLMLAMGSAARADQISFNLTTEETTDDTVPAADQITVTVTTGTGVTSSACPAGSSGVDCVSVEFSAPSGVTLGSDPI